MTLSPESDAPSPAAARHLRPADLRAVARLAVQATQAVVDITEGVHQSVRRTLGLPGGARPGRTGGIPGQVYRAVRGVTQLVGLGLDAVLAGLLPWLEDAPVPDSPAREAVLSALNGVMGDRLRVAGSPLALSMVLRHQGRDLLLADPPALRGALAGATPHLLLLVHGLCMNDRQWRRDGHDHGADLAQALGWTPVYLRYNTGLPVAENGRELAAQLEALVAAWPVPLTGLAILGHSMGGLVARSAQHQARQAGLRWPAALRQMVFLGTPHHGAPLEQAGHGVDLLLAATPWSAPFARLGHLRSAGITDLRHGHLLAGDGQGRGRFGPGAGADRRQPVPLPPDVACYAVAGTLAQRRSLLADRLTGDGLVPLRSALGEHADPRRRLRFPRERRWIAWQTGHLALLSSPDVARQLRHWLVPATGRPGSPAVPVSASPAPGGGR